MSSGMLGIRLDGTTIGNDAVLHVVRPQSAVNQVLEQPRVDDLEFSSEHTTGVDVGSVWFEAFVEAHDLRGGCSRHGRNEQRVADTMLGNLGLERIPVPKIGWSDIPHVILKLALGDR